MPQREERSDKRPNTPSLAWITIEGGVELRLTIPGIDTQKLSAEAFHHLRNSFERLAVITTALLEDDRLAEQGRSLEGSLSFLSVHMLDVMSFFEQMSVADGDNTSDPKFPF